MGLFIGKFKILNTFYIHPANPVGILYSKLTIITPTQNVTFAHGEQQRHQNDVIDDFLMFLLLTLNRMYSAL